MAFQYLILINKWIKNENAFAKTKLTRAISKENIV